MSVAECVKAHRDYLGLTNDASVLEKVLADASINPRRRTVQWWFDEWRRGKGTTKPGALAGEIKVQV